MWHANQRTKKFIMATKNFQVIFYLSKNQRTPYEKNYWTNITSAQFNSFRSSKGYDISPVMHDLIPSTTIYLSSINIYDPRSYLHKLHGGGLDINASTSVHKDNAEPTELSPLSLEACNVKSHGPSQKRHVLTPIAPVMPSKCQFLP